MMSPSEFISGPVFVSLVTNLLSPPLWLPSRSAFALFALAPLLCLFCNRDTLVRASQNGMEDRGVTQIQTLQTLGQGMNPH